MKKYCYKKRVSTYNGLIPIYPKANVIKVSGLANNISEAKVWLTVKDKQIQVACYKESSDITRALKAMDFNKEQINLLPGTRKI